MSGRRRVAPLRPSLRGRLPARTVPIYIGADYLSRLGDILRPAATGLPLGLLIDRIVDRFCGEHVSGVLRRAGWAVRRSVLTGGEAVKSQAVVDALHAQWFAAGFDRTTPIVAVGGGTVGDAIGYAAATFLRGVPLWQVPTSIVAQVDAAIGGKVGINHDRGKNLIGCFYHPRGIVIDPALLSTLPVRERGAGLAEVIKYGVIADPVLFRLCERRVPGWVAGTIPLDAAVVRRCVRIKLRVVEADETDMGKRHILNFGHTLGHTFERWGGFRDLHHGEAVMLGMVAVGHIASCRGIFSAGDFDRLQRLCLFLRPRLAPIDIPAGDVMEYLRFDKKRASGKNLWILPVRIGAVRTVDDVTEREIRDALTYLHQWALGREQRDV